MATAQIDPNGKDYFALNRRVLQPTDVHTCCDYCLKDDRRKKPAAIAKVVYDFGQGEEIYACPSHYDSARLPYEPTFAELTQ